MNRHPREWWVLVIATIILSAIAFGIFLLFCDHIHSAAYPFESHQKTNSTQIIFVMTDKRTNGEDNWTHIGDTDYNIYNTTEFESLKVGYKYLCNRTVSWLPGLNNTIYNCREITTEIFNKS